MRLPLVVLAAALLAGCSCFQPRQATPALFIVVPSAADGHVGAIVVHHGAESRVIDSAFGAERLRADGSLERSKLEEREVRERFADVMAALPGTPATFTLYFLEGSDELTPQSRAELDNIFAELKRRPLPDIVVIGHSDTVGSDSYNDQLSLARAKRMREMLVGLGIPAERIDAAGRGKRELLVPTEDNVAEARNRRVEINVR